MTQLQQIIALIIGIGAVVGLVYGAYRWVAPRLRRLTARVGGTVDAIAGRPPMVDRATGREVSPAVPPLGVRLDRFEQGQAHLASVMTELTKVISEQRHQDSRLDDHDARITNLEAAAIERTVARAESAAMLNLVAQELDQTNPTPPD